MKIERWKIITLVVLGIFTVVMLFLAAFRFFAPAEKGADIVTNSAAVSADATSHLYVSEDGGASWRGVAGGQFTPFHIEFDGALSRLLVGTEKDSLWYAGRAKLDRVTQFEDASGVLPLDTAIFDITLQKGEPRVYLATRRGDRGYVLELSNSALRELFFVPLEDTPIRSLVLDPFTKGTILIGAGTGLYASEDGGETWRVLYRFRQEIMHITAHPHAPGLYFVATRRGELFRSSDRGETWKDLTRGFSKLKGSRDNQHLYVDAATGSVYLTSDHGLIASWDDGTTWHDIPLIVPPDSLPIVGFAVHPTNPDIVYVSASSQLYKSEDGGRTWKGTRFPDKGSITVITIDPAHPAVVVIGFAE